MAKLTKGEKKWKLKYTRLRDSLNGHVIEDGKKRIRDLDDQVKAKDIEIAELRKQVKELEKKVDV